MIQAPGPSVIKTFFFLNKPSLMFARAYPIEAPFRCSTLEYAPGDDVIKLFCVQFMFLKYATVFVPLLLFQPSLMFAGKDRAYPSEVPFRCSTQG
jgi:hypothetical protein